MAELHRHTLGNTRFIEVDANPNGSITAPAGAIAMNSTGGAVYVNTDGATAWSDLRQAANTTTSGIVERATQAEVDAGTDASRYVTPETLAGWSIAPGAAFSAFDLNNLGASYSTGALGFTPTTALAFWHWGTSGSRMGWGISNGTSIASPSPHQHSYDEVTTSTILDTNSFIRGNGFSEWATTAFSSSGITITRQSGTAALDEGIMLVFAGN